MYIHFNTGYPLRFPKLNRNIIYCLWCEILSKDGAIHMNPVKKEGKELHSFCHNTKRDGGESYLKGSRGLDSLRGSVR